MTVEEILAAHENETAEAIRNDCMKQRVGFLLNVIDAMLLAAGNEDGDACPPDAKCPDIDCGDCVLQWAEGVANGA